ncbi:DUF898 domain-containing protein [Pseudothauera nasutitermitis]|uniref:DUF898 domain-containing protein n=1 Tax=Pseudothauera nasutitermitis TaxID=2565930 RepID=A0A4V3WC90_9RHOO|nr:YjgN family protein [Pseudothauera nasutitermitis]THF66298.1 DUF898 domain-containing protein [Pseudothauera nasutitermitis]
MSNAAYALVFQGGILAGFEREQVMERFGELFGLSVEDVEKIFGHPRVVLKRNLSEQSAQAYIKQLSGIGMAVSLHAPDAAAAAPAAGVEAGAPAPLALVAEPSADAGHVPPAGTVTAAPGAAADGARVDLPFEFTGRGGEFFRIWIVNILLTILTLSVYSAWAKVRTLRYFYGNTRLDGSSFEYLAEPLQILKGRLIAFGMLILYMLADRFMPPLAIAMMLVFFLILPWIMVRAMAFRSHYSAWRGVRFGFDGSLGEAYKVFLLWPLLSLLTVGLLFPYALYRQQRFVVERSRYGTQLFGYGARAASFYLIFLALIGVSVGGAVLAALLGWLLPVLTPVAIVAMYLTLFALFNVMMTNVFFNHTRLGGHALRSNYQLGSYALLMITNTLGLVLTLGLFYPWARVRSARYAAAHTGLVAEGSLDEFVSAQRDGVSALGGEIGDVFDVDLGF